MLQGYDNGTDLDLYDVGDVQDQGRDVSSASLIILKRVVQDEPVELMTWLALQVFTS